MKYRWNRTTILMGRKAASAAPFRVIKRQFGHVKARYRGLAKNTAQLHMLFALSNLWMARRTLMGAQSASANGRRAGKWAESGPMHSLGAADTATWLGRS